MAVASGTALAASVVYAPLRPFSRVFQWAALGLSGAAVMQNSKEQAELEKKVKDLVFENAHAVFSSATPNKSPDELTDRETLQLALLEDHDREKYFTTKANKDGCASISYSCARCVVVNFGIRLNGH